MTFRNQCFVTNRFLCYIIFQEDNDPKHTANVVVKQWWADQQLTRMEWPSQSPDLNPIENLWSLLDKAARDRRPNTDQELFESLNVAWNALEPDLLTRKHHAVGMYQQKV